LLTTKRLFNNRIERKCAPSLDIEFLYRSRSQVQTSSGPAAMHTTTVSRLRRCAGAARHSSFESIGRPSTAPPPGSCSRPTASYGVSRCNMKTTVIFKLGQKSSEKMLRHELRPFCTKCVKVSSRSRLFLGMNSRHKFRLDKKKK